LYKHVTKTRRLLGHVIIVKKPRFEKPKIPLVLGEKVDPKNYLVITT